MKQTVGYCFNNEVYYHLAKGLIPVEILEMCSNQTVLSPSCLLPAPSMYLKLIWDEDRDYKWYYNQIFANLHD